jgi:uncharacterized protein YpiB (UPF0302 family)
VVSGSGTVSSIVANYKAGLDELDFNSIRQLAVVSRQQGLNLSELASHVSLYNFFRKTGIAEDKIESFISDVSSNELPAERAIELVYQLHEMSKKGSIPLDQISDYIKQKLEEKQKIDQDIKEANDVLQTKNANIEAVDEYLRLKEATTIQKAVTGFNHYW